MTLLRRTTVPSHRFARIRHHTTAVGVKEPQRDLRLSRTLLGYPMDPRHGPGMALLGGQAIPPQRLHLIWLDATARSVRGPKGDLRLSMTLLRRTAVPGQGHSLVLRNTAAVPIPIPEVDLRLGKSLLCLCA